MGKIISFELKKLVSRIGIYILVLLLAGLLVASAFMYKPEHPIITSPGLVGETVSDMYTNFKALETANKNTLNSISLEASSYVDGSDNYNAYNNSTTLKELLETFDNLCLLYAETTTANKPDYATLLASIRSSLENLKTKLFNEAFDYSQEDSTYYVLTTNQNYSKLKTLLNSIPIYASSFDGQTYINQYRLPIYECINKLIYPDLGTTAQKYIQGGVYYNLVSTRMDEIAYKIDQEYAKVVSDSSLNDNAIIKRDMNNLYAKYSNCIEVFETAFNTSITVNAISSVASKSDRSNLYVYNNIDLYEQKELEAKYVYYLENNTGKNSYASDLSVTHTSNEKTNAYDFTFFVMSLFTIAIVLFAIYLASHTIAGEISNKSMRFTAIRPVSRGSLFFGKFVAIIVMSTILLLFSTATSLCVGGIMYGFDSLNILMVINGNSVLVAHPLLMIALFTLSNLLLIILYTAIAMLFSTIIKSELLAMLISILIYAGNLVLPLFFGATSWLRFYPLANINLYAYFGSGHPASESILAKLFNNVIYQGMNIWVTIAYIVGITTLLLTIGKIVFKKRQL